MRTVYLDNNATTAVAPEVVEAMMPFFTERYGNPSSAHAFGGNVAKDLERARERLAQLLGSDPCEILFTSCGTESDGTAIRAALQVNLGKRHIVTSRVEHPAVRALCAWLGERGYRVTEVGVDSEGLLDMAELESALTPDTAVVSIMWANNETGVLFPVERIAEMCRERGILFHTDAVQAVGKIPIDMRKSAVDMLSLSGHKLHAPKGIGALFVRKGTPFEPLMIGGHQERGRRAGTENIAFIVGVGKACELAAATMDKEGTRVKALRDRLEGGLLKTVPESRRNGHKTQRLPNTTNIGFRYVEGEAILLLLDREGICASSGSACTSGSLQPSHVLSAMGVPMDYKQSATRFSLSRYTTDTDIDRTLKAMPRIVKRLRQISPFTPAGAAP